MPIDSLDIEFHDLEGLPRAKLRARWREVFCEQPPAAFGRELLALGIAYVVQERQFGGLSKSRAREIDRLLDHAPIALRGERQAPAVTVTRPGTVLVREWQGTTHQVTVLADGYGWNGQHHKLADLPIIQSISSISRLPKSLASEFRIELAPLPVLMLWTAPPPARERHRCGFC